MRDEENDQIKKSSEASQTTGGSTGGSTDESNGGSTESEEKVQPIEVPKLDEKKEVEKLSKEKVVTSAKLTELSIMQDGKIEPGLSDKKYDGLVPVKPMSEEEKSNLKDGKWYHEKKWQYEELKKMLPAKMKKQISKYFIMVSRPSRFNADEVIEAEEFFKREFPHRSPGSVYQKAMLMKRKGVKRIVLL